MTMLQNVNGIFKLWSFVRHPYDQMCLVQSWHDRLLHSQLVAAKLLMFTWRGCTNTCSYFHVFPIPLVKMVKTGLLYSLLFDAIPCTMASSMSLRTSDGKEYTPKITPNFAGPSAVRFVELFNSFIPSCNALHRSHVMFLLLVFFFLPPVKSIVMCP